MNIMCLSIYVGLYWFSSLYFVIFTVQILSRFQFSSVQFSRSVVSNSLQLHESQHARPPSITNSQSPPKPMSIELTMPSNHLILCHPLLLLPSIFPSIRVFPSESALCIRWPKYWSFSLNLSPSNDHQGLISFRKDWLDFLAVQGTLKSLLLHHNSKALILWHSAFFMAPFISFSSYHWTLPETILIAYLFLSLVLLFLFIHLLFVTSINWYGLVSV